MMKMPFLAFSLVLICLILASSGCAATKGEGFAVYLTRENIPPASMPAMSHVGLADQPIISMNDVTTYNSQTHELKLTDTAFKRIAQLEVPVSGKSFMVCVDKKPVYWGAFWTPISSISFDGVTIWKPYSTQAPSIVTLELGYPSSSFYGGEDPRNSPEVLKSLDEAGKLVTGLSIEMLDTLPDSLKGLELYSWSENGQWHFTLISGTDRNKTLDEIVSQEDFISETGWVNVHVAGVDNLKTVLSKLPQNASVFWLAGMRSDQPAPAGVSVTLPPKSIIDAIQEYARTRGLTLSIQGP